MVTTDKVTVTEFTPHIGKTTTDYKENNMELISRDEAIKTARLMIGLTADERENEIRAIPTVEERKEGRWIHESCSRLIDETDEGRVYTIEKRWYCSRCGFSKGFRMYRPDEKYCPNCGAKMIGE